MMYVVLCLEERWLKPGAEYASSQPLGKGTAASAAPSSESQPDEADEASTLSAGGVPASGADSSRSKEQAPLRWLPFGLGPRDCIGQSLARLNYTATLATLLGHFSFRLAPEVGAQEVASMAALLNKM